MTELKKIIILAWYGHHDIVDNIINLLQESPFKISLYTSNSHTKKRYQSQSNLITEYLPDENPANLLKNYQEQIKNTDLLLIITVFKDFDKYHQLSKWAPTSFIIHNAHFSLSDKHYLTYSPRHLWSLISGTIKYKRDILYTAKNIFVLSANVQQYVLNNYPISKKVTLLSYRYTKGNQGLIKKGKIIIPGGINRRHRNYEFFINWLQGKNYPDDLEIVFLGKSIAKDVQRFQRSLSPDVIKISVRYFTDYLSQEEYEDELRNASLLLVPLRKTIDFYGYREIYGKSKITGGVNDAIKFSIPIILPSFYPTEETTKDLSFHYSDQRSFDEQLNKLLQPSHQSDPVNNDLTFTQVRTQLIAQLNKTINT